MSAKIDHSRKLAPKNFSEHKSFETKNLGGSKSFFANFPSLWFNDLTPRVELS